MYGKFLASLLLYEVSIFMSTIQIMIINDSRSVRLFLEQLISSYDDFTIVGSYSDAAIALDNLDYKRPDVILLDLEMPHMDGFTFLEKLSKPDSFPTIILSNYVKNDSELVSEALTLGAVDSLALPSKNISEDFDDFKNLLYHKISKAALASKLVQN